MYKIQITNEENKEEKVPDPLKASGYVVIAIDESGMYNTVFCNVSAEAISNVMASDEILSTAAVVAEAKMRAESYRLTRTAGQLLVVPKAVQPQGPTQ